MMARNHMPFAMACWWGYALITGQSITGLASLMAGLGGLLPDLDHPESTVGRRVRLISLPLSALVGHRGMTHSVLAVVGMAALMIAVTNLPALSGARWAILPLCVGYLSHLLGDGLTKGGIPLLWPSKRRYSLNLFHTNSWKETVLVGALTLGLLTVGGVGEQILGQAWQKIWMGIAF